MNACGAPSHQRTPIISSKDGIVWRMVFPYCRSSTVYMNDILLYEYCNMSRVLFTLLKGYDISNNDSNNTLKMCDTNEFVKNKCLLYGEDHVSQIRYSNNMSKNASKSYISVYVHLLPQKLNY